MRFLLLDCSRNSSSIRHVLVRTSITSIESLSAEKAAAARNSIEKRETEQQIDEEVRFSSTELSFALLEQVQ